jgi:hypothetical protein
MGVPSLTVYDPDVVESANIPSSAYRHALDIGRPKVEALRDLVAEATCLTIEIRRKAYEGEELRGAVVCCVDTIEARRLVWERVRRRSDADNILIDTRVDAELVWVFALDPRDPDDIGFYEPYLAFSSKEAHQPTCGRHGTIYTSWAAARAVCADLKSWWQRGTKKRDHRELAGSLEPLD